MSKNKEQLESLKSKYQTLKKELEALSKEELEVVTNENIMLKEVYDRVFDVGTYNELDYEYAKKYFASEFDKWQRGGLCTAVCKVLDDKSMIIGRNMDLTICNKAAYIMRTNVEGFYKTVGLAYTFRNVSPDYDDVIKNGITTNFHKVLPFLCDDVLNEKGLYIEVNMRNGETWPTGETKFGCSGTNPSSKERVYLFELSRYIGEHCANVDEALEYVKTLDIYSMYGHEMHSDNYCFMLADESGHYGVLEFAMNKMFWHEGQCAQANFYIDENLSKIQSLKTGNGRYNKVMEGVSSVKTKEDMFNLIDSVSYYQAYFPDKCQFDNRSEFVGTLPYWTYDYLMSGTSDMIKEFETIVGYIGKYLKTKTRQEIRDMNYFWESVFTEVVDCNKREIFVRFYEDNSKTLLLKVDH